MTLTTAAPTSLHQELRTAILEHLLHGQALLPDTPTHVMEVVGILKSYGVVLKAMPKTSVTLVSGSFSFSFPFSNTSMARLPFPSCCATGGTTALTTNTPSTVCAP